MTFLVTDAALDRNLAEDRGDRCAQRLATVQNDENALLAVQAALHEVGEQLAADRRVLRRSVPQPERDLDAVGRDAEADDAAAALQIDAVEHQRRETHPFGRRKAGDRSTPVAPPSRTGGRDRSGRW